MKNCAVIGMGLLGTQHADRLNAHGNTRVVAVCDIKTQKAQAWAEENGAHAYSNYDEMFENEEIDLVVVATQDPYHKEPLLSACTHKVPYVIAEKPLCTTLEDALEVQKAARASGTVIKVLFPNRFYPLDRSIRLLVRENYIGRPEYGEFRIDDSIDVPLQLWGKDSHHFASISSPAFFLLSHAVDLLTFLFGQKVVKVYAIGRKSIIGSDVDYMDCFLTYDGGLTIRLKTEWTKRIDKLCENYMQFTGTQGGFIFNKTGGFQCQQGLSFVMDAGKVRAEKARQRLEECGYSASIEPCGQTGGYAVVMREGDQGNGFDWNSGVCIYADSFDSDEDPMSPLTTLEGGIEQVRVVEALLRSAQEKKEIIL